MKYNYNNEVEEFEEDKYKVLSPWKYAWYTILFCLPLIGLIFLIGFAFSEKNIHRRNYARSFFYLVIIFIVLYVLHEYIIYPYFW